MVHKIIAIGRVETRRLIWIAALLFALVAALQYFELPYGSFLPALNSTGKSPVQEKTSLQNGDSNHTLTEMIPTKHSETKSLSLVDDISSDKDSLVERNSTSKPENENNFDDDGLLEEEAREPEPSFDGSIGAIHNDSSTGTVGNETIITSLDDSGSLSLVAATPPPSSPSLTTESVLDRNAIAPPPPMTGDSNASVVVKERSSDSEEQGRLPMIKPPETKKPPKKKVLDVYSLSDMDDLLIQSRDSYYSMIPRWSAAVDREIQDAASQIENAPIIQNDPNLYAPLYRNVSKFKRSYELMEKMLKVYVYKEGERPILHTPILKGIYASEGWFMKQLESNKKFVTKNPAKAHLFYLPFSSRMLEEALYVVGSHSHKNLINYLKSYEDLIAGKYPYWNRTGGADHFLVACHDWAASETRKIMAKCIRALCNSDVKEGFTFGKDVSLPETYIQLPKNPVRDLGGKPPSKRTTLAFFAGSMHGYLRPILLRHWENKDPNMKIFGKLPKKKGNKSYSDYMKSSKYCICAKGYEVNSPRVVEALFHECVPVIVSDNFVPPFFGVLNWDSFAVFVAESDVPDLKAILTAIPEARYRELQMNVRRVQRHFLWHSKPQKYDIFHMILHSIWYNRLHQIRPS